MSARTGISTDFNYAQALKGSPVNSVEKTDSKKKHNRSMLKKVFTEKERQGFLDAERECEEQERTWIRYSR